MRRVSAFLVLAFSLSAAAAEAPEAPQPRVTDLSAIAAPQDAAAIDWDAVAAALLISARWTFR